MVFSMTTLSYFDRDNPSLPFPSISDHHIRQFSLSYSFYHSKNKKYKNSSYNHSNNDLFKSQLTSAPTRALPPLLKNRHTQSKFRKQYDRRHLLIFSLRAQERKKTRKRLFRERRIDEEHQHSENERQQDIKRKESERTEHQRKAQAQRWLRNFRILVEEKRQETIRTEADQFEQQRNIEDQPGYKNLDEQYAKETKHKLDGNRRFERRMEQRIEQPKHRLEQTNRQIEPRMGLFDRKLKRQFQQILADGLRQQNQIFIEYWCALQSKNEERHKPKRMDKTSNENSSYDSAIVPTLSSNDPQESSSFDDDASFNELSISPDLHEQDDGVDGDETSASNDPASTMIFFENDILTEKSLQITDSTEQTDDDDDDEKSTHLSSVLSLSPTIPNDTFGTHNTTPLAVIDTFSLDKSQIVFLTSGMGMSLFALSLTTSSTKIQLFSLLPPSVTELLRPTLTPSLPMTLPRNFILSFHGRLLLSTTLSLLPFRISLLNATLGQAYFRVMYYVLWWQVVVGSFWYSSITC